MSCEWSAVVWLRHRRCFRCGSFASGGGVGKVVVVVKQRGCVSDVVVRKQLSRCLRLKQHRRGASRTARTLNIHHGCTHADAVILFPVHSHYFLQILHRRRLRHAERGRVVFPGAATELPSTSNCTSVYIRCVTVHLVPVRRQFLQYYRREPGCPPQSFLRSQVDAQQTCRVLHITWGNIVDVFIIVVIANASSG